MILQLTKNDNLKQFEIDMNITGKTQMTLQEYKEYLTEVLDTIVNTLDITIDTTD